MRLNLLYLYAPGFSTWDENEIRYSLRSMSETNDVDWVGIVGPAVPDFLQGITHIKHELKAGRKFANLLGQLLTAMADERVPEDLILMNDDFYMRQTPAWDWTPTHLGPVTYKPRNPWQKSVSITGAWLSAKGFTPAPLNYEGHTPMPIKKSLALQTLKAIIADITDKKIMQFRTAYGNMHNIGGKQHINAKHKTWDKWPEDSPFFSSKGAPGDDVKAGLENLWPRKSRWEK